MNLLVSLLFSYGLQLIIFAGLIFAAVRHRRVRPKAARATIIVVLLQFLSVAIGMILMALGNVHTMQVQQGDGWDAFANPQNWRFIATSWVQGLLPVASLLIMGYVILEQPDRQRRDPRA